MERESKEPLKAILYWQMAIMAYASMRFDDALHTSPALITERGGGVELVSWETKVERRMSWESLRSWFGIIKWTPFAFHRFGRVLKRTAPESYL